MPALTKDLPKLQMYIDGSFVEHASGAYLESYDPYTGKPLAQGEMFA